ncbi:MULTISPECIES: sulfur oxidation c-type cytochrome SoxX [Thalassospira]|jgi:sulfur-oxidizing protein SoxX|uniref:sulfur oxidation c-type cytochrome SoxX n=1 Tax=Thalassospira TaxID=168934 RepID=UPI0007A58F26|nr:MULTISPECIES: sulfur oxidation c-type cytochrome SoxX [unclassified Thalassospira]KZC97838.1 sulfur oxidation c-type cytochrome SoxX [Thalassospira sp. MCCC 1A02898]ONH87990.1 monoheme cytochrome C SoxX [Thalassospira sp. MCCC 1A02803]BDW88941.1 sulfur oxidation c-type cytochrome SoxX [Thalassospira tepidiphila]
MSWKPRAFLACLIVGLPALAAADALAPADVKFDDMSVSQSLTSQPGDPENGRKVFANRSLGNCLACHAVKDQSDQLFHGEVGPPLDGAADRWSEGELRAIVADAKEVFSEETVMPGFYSLNVGINVREDLVGKTILTAQEVEDVVAYLATLKE